MSDKKKSEFEEEDFSSPNDLEALKERAEALIREELAKASAPFSPSVPFAPEPPKQPSTSVQVTGSTKRPSVDMDRYRQEKQNAISGDNLLQIIRSGSNSFTLLDKVIEEIAEESAGLKFERDFAESPLFDPVKTSKTRAQILKIIGDLLVTKRELAQTNVINLHSKKLQAVFKYIITIVKQSLDATEEIAPEARELFFQTLIRNLEGFEDRAEEVMSKIEED